MKTENGYAQSFAKLIQCPTVTDSGSEYFAAFHKVLREEFPLVHQNCEITNVGGDALLYKWKGKDNSKPVVLMAHQDVVPAVDGKWTHAPYGGEIAGGKVWGRGTMDCKNTLFCTIQAVEELLAEGIVPEQDIYLSYSDNEETSGAGAPAARDWFKQHKVRPAIVVDEGGAIVESAFPGMTKPFAMVGILEKGYADVKFIAKSAGGHSSQPPKNTPIARLSKFVNYCETHTVFKRKMSEQALEMLRSLSDGLTGGLKFVTKNIDMLSGLVVALLPKLTPLGGALFGTTMTFTMSGGSAAPNVIPQEAYVIANLRFSPNDKSAKCFKKLEKIAKKYDLETEVLTYRDASPAVDTDSDEYKYFIETVKKTFPDIGIAPYLIFGGTDCRTMQEICRTAIRWTPCRLDTQQLASMHAADENINIESLNEGVTFFKNLIRDFK